MQAQPLASHRLENETSGRPLVSVVMPMYNVARYVAEAVDSVLAQTYPNWELIAVDDGSPDTSREIVERYADPRIRVVRRENGGLSAARNTGIRHARGAYVALLDADDCWLPEKLERHVAHLLARPEVGLSYSGSQFMNEAGVPLANRQTPKLGAITPQDVFCSNPVGNGSAPVLRREALAEAARGAGQEYFCEGLRQSEDVELWLRIALATRWRIEGIDGHLTLYRVNQAGLSANVDAQLAAWLAAVENNWLIAPRFIERWFPTAAAMQCRYLARRAVQSRDARTALKLLGLALRYRAGALLMEPRKTLGTVAGAAAVALLPSWVIDRLQAWAGRLAL